MSETIKVLIAGVFIICFLIVMFLGVFVATEGPPKDMPNIWFILGPAIIIGIISLAILLWLQLKKDIVPDYLRQVSKTYFERDGFCFAITLSVIDNQCNLIAYYQSRYENEVHASILIRPTPGFFKNVDMAGCELQIKCPPAGFGMMMVPFAIPICHQGKRLFFDVWAATIYPSGKGKMLRFRDGMAVGKAPKPSWVSPAMIVGGAMLGALVLPGKPARTALVLPQGVHDSVPNDSPITSQTLWQLGDPLLQPASSFEQDKLSA